MLVIFNTWRRNKAPSDEKVILVLKVIAVSLTERVLFSGAARDALAHSLAKMKKSRASCFIIETEKGRRITMHRQQQIAKRLGILK